MRILTTSPIDKKGLISIVESGENMPQVVVFCVPISKREAKKINNIFDFEDYFYHGISTKIIDKENTITIGLKYMHPRQLAGENTQLPKFVAEIKGRKVDFYLSPLNFNENDKHRLNIDFYYNGRYLKNELDKKRLVVLEPNWSELDKLFLEERITFADWTTL